MKMKNAILFVCGFLAIAADSYGSETVFGPSTIRVGTNEVILLTTICRPGGMSLLVDGVDFTGGLATESPPVYAIAGPRAVVVTNDYTGADFYVTFQRLTNSPIKTVLAFVSSTNFINVPTGKTIQMFPLLSEDKSRVTVQPQGSTNWFRCFSRVSYPSITGPAKVRIMLAPDYEWPTALSYYFTDEVVQFPPQGLLSVPAPVLQVNVEMSSDLTNWTPKAVFHTDAEAHTFYRLKMLK